MNIQLIRHATLLVHMHSRKILVDPMLSPAGAMSTVANAANTLRNPLVNLTVNVAELLSADAVLLTHTHRDHFDDVAATLLPKDIPFFCQPADKAHVEKYGFTDVRPVETDVSWHDIHITRTGGQHGSGELATKMGPVSGYILAADNDPSLYIAGDTIWCKDVQDALTLHHPDVTVVFAGSAQFLSGGPITMDEQGITKLCRHSPATKVFVAHMEAWSHCLLTRNSLRETLHENGLTSQVVVPVDGEIVNFLK
ncbi:MBL fold metallo-hydrolase [Alicyclobacillus dauci]|uniref:MBL fold metallo-hydrolase n=1 Tax=Alicyclobacillus dauci TaxID=1475485 RepID=A0ABY6Z417_9BACL|nr:MBL fold metallo-hydrolase [Alicyclobacillus dauci]WAH36941.1 MBL fold metallo-hydrolase [Alicyclobacillus dauci]